MTEKEQERKTKKKQHSNIFIAVSVRHLEGQGADGCRQLVRSRSRRGSASHAPRVQHDDRHVCELWEGSPIAGGRKQDVRKRDHRLGKWHRIQGRRQQQHGVLRVSRRRVGDVTEKEGAPVAYSNLFLQGGYSRSDDHVCLLLHWDWTGSSGRQLFSGQPKPSSLNHTLTSHYCSSSDIWGRSLKPWASSDNARFNWYSVQPACLEGEKKHKAKNWGWNGNLSVCVLTDLRCREGWMPSFWHHK